MLEAKKPTVGFWNDFWSDAGKDGCCCGIRDCKFKNREELKKRLRKLHFFWAEPLFFCKKG